MEGKTVFLSVLIMSLVMAQIQVEAKSCCPTTTARNIYNTCRYIDKCHSVDKKTSQEKCASLTGCKTSMEICPPGYRKLEKTDDTASANEYCKLGCASSVCGALATLHNSDASEIVNEAVEKCTEACSTLCTKGSFAALEVA